MILGNKKLVPYSSVYTVAEIGVNHNGSLELAKKCIDAAIEAGADAVKFQLFDPNTLVTIDADKAPYQAINFLDKVSQYDMLTEFNLTIDEHFELRDYCNSIGIDFSTTPYDRTDFKNLEKLSPDWVKIASMHFVEQDFIKEALNLGFSTVLSTGMCSASQIDDLRGRLSFDEINRIVILQCTTQYPCPASELNIRVIGELLKSWKYVGFSDHSASVIAPALAVLQGAVLIEKHFTLDNNSRGPDHKASLEPPQFKKMVDQIKIACTMSGSFEKKVLHIEEENILSMRRSLISIKDIQVGEGLIEGVNYIKKRPFLGDLSNLDLEKLSKAIKFIPAGTIIKKEDIVVDR